jgi:hypothetical protein
MEHPGQIARVEKALKAIDGIRVTRGWPKDFARLPCVAISLAGESKTDRRDDRAYLIEVAYYLRIFTDTSKQMDELLESIDNAMEAIGYEQSFFWGEDDATIKQTVLRYKTIL